MTETVPPFGKLREVLIGAGPTTNLSHIRRSSEVAQNDPFQEILDRLPEIPDFSSLPVGDPARINRIKEWIDTNQVRTHQMECLALFIPEVWKKVQENAHYINPPDLTSINLPSGMLYPIKTPEQRLDILKWHINKMALKACNEWGEEIDREIEQVGKAGTLRLQVYTWFKKAISLIDEDGDPKFSPEKDPNLPKDLVRSGFNTAITTTLDSLFVLPNVYYKYQIRHPELLEVPNISIMPFMTTLLSGSQEILHRLLTALAKKTDKSHARHESSKKFFSTFDSQYFELKELHGTLALGIKDEVLDALEDPYNPGILIKDLRPSYPVTGCPARYSRAATEFIRWAEGLYRYYQLPLPGEIEDQTESTE